MWLPPQQQSTLTELFQTALVKLCSEHIPFSGRLELDGLICITNGDIAKQIVVKIHKVMEQGDNGVTKPANQITPVQNNVSVGQSLLKPCSNGTANIEAVDRKRACPDDDEDDDDDDDSMDVKEFTGLQSRGSTPVQLNNVASDLSKSLIRSMASVKEEMMTISPALSRHFTDDSLNTSIPTSKILVVDAKSPDLGKFLPVNANKKQPTQILKLLTIPSAARPSPSVLTGKPENKPSRTEPKVSLASESLSDKLDEQPVSCKLCGSISPSRNTLESHVRLAHRRFLCRICLNMFTLSCNLRRHMKLHAGVRPHACNKCSASFSRSTDLRIHMRKHETGRAGSDGSLPGTPVKRSDSLRCQICEQSFDSMDQLSIHRRRHEESLMLHGTDRLLLSPDAEYNDDEQPMELTMNNNNNNVKTLVNGFNFADNNIKPFILDSFLNRYLVNKGAVGGADWSTPFKNSDMMNDFAPLLNLSSSGLGRDSMLPTSSAHSNSSDSDEGLLDLSSKESARSDEPINYGKDSTHDMSLSGGSSTSPGIGSRSKRKGQPMKITDGSALCTQPVNEEEESAGDNDDSSESFESSNLEIVLDASGAEDLSGGDNGDAVTVKEDVGAGEDLPTPPPLSRRAVNNEGEGVEGEEVLRPPPPLTRKPGEEGGEGDVLEGCLFKCRYAGCDTCWFGFKAYERHFTSVHNRFPCSQCDQSFTSRNNRRRHAIMHTDAKRHPCETCNKLFARPDIVKEHRLTHTRSYRTSTCTNCGTQFDKKVALLSHLKKCLKPEDIDGDISLDGLTTAAVSASVEETEETGDDSLNESVNTVSQEAS